MKITKETIDKAINFLETIPEEGFCRGVFTEVYDFSHCSLGWLAESYKAPFSLDQAIGISNLCDNSLGDQLTKFNDQAPEGQIKATVINALCLLKENL